MSKRRQVNKSEQEDKIGLKKRRSHQNSPDKVLQTRLLQRAVENPLTAQPETILQMQRLYGNKAVGQWVNRQNSNLLNTIQREDGWETVGSSKQSQPKLTPEQKAWRNVDYDKQDIVGKLDEIVSGERWTGNFGPTVNITTKLNRQSNGKFSRYAWSLYQDIKKEYHNQSVPGHGRWVYYVTRLGSWGKAGFRITGHTNSDIKKSTTKFVLHVDN